jgi:uncharacterized repeat protein (TIGR04076 family)
MNINEAAWKTLKWKLMKRRLGYNRDEMDAFRQNPRNEDILSKVPDLMGKTIILQVVDSHGCNSQHKVGDEFFFDGAGNLLTKFGPKRICVHALSAASTLIFAANELLYAGVDPNEMRFNRVACAADVGLECGGWGRVVMEIRVADRREVEQEIE